LLLIFIQQTFYISGFQQPEVATTRGVVNYFWRCRV